MPLPRRTQVPAASWPSWRPSRWTRLRAAWAGFARVAAACVSCGALLHPASARAQAVTHRGFVDVRGTVYPQDAANDRQHVVADLRAREEVFVRPASWLRFAGGLDAAANTYDQVEHAWRLDWRDRRIRRPALSLRRLTATVSRGRFTLDAGKQFIRWGKADIVTPTDRFAPRDYLNVIDTEFLGVTGGRAVLARGGDSVEAVVVPRFTPSRVPLLDQRWTPTAPGVELIDGSAASALPKGAQAGLRWAHLADGHEWSLSIFNGYNHLPNVQTTVPPLPPVSGGAALPPGVPGGVIPVTVTRSYPHMRMYGGDAAVPTRWITVKGEAAYFESNDAATDEFVLYVVQAERQTGEWLFIGGYAGTAVTNRRAAGTFAPDRGTARSFLGRASYTIDANRSAAVEAAVRQNGDGVYVKGEWSAAAGEHWRATVTGVVIRGQSDDFLGQFRRNSNLAIALRYSF